VQRSLAKIFVSLHGAMDNFACGVNEELTLDFDNASPSSRIIMRFTSDDEFDAIFRRVQEAGIWAAIQDTANRN